MENLKKVFVLNELKGNDNFLQILLEYCYILDTSKGDIIYKEADNSNEMYILLEGTVRVYKRTNAGEQFLLAELSSANGSFFGEMSLIRAQERTATVQTESDAKLLVLSRRDFIRMAKVQPSIAIGLTFSICQILSERLQRSNADLAYLCDALAYEASEA
ncbi:cyclic nucleotide-binding domain-containing protein [Candidatus Haliotispira prima]|uniref:Cyclic nucleotide-binding domain-containing protein n=1 Tax=Candidatus Haliotispira prima TaxID=3034016 RepID=A0ABY8MH64_9SPIO|nr:cyclic nucleotide-binding domain-containing protein [Candidatus Haliotispira prima]